MDSATVTIRPALGADVPGITAVYRPAVLNGTASFEVEPPDEAEMGRRYESITGAGYPYLVAALSGHICGYAYVASYRPRPAYRYVVENSIYVAPEYYRRGIGRKLLIELIEAAAREGFRQMIAVIGDSDQVASIALHRSAGFVHCGIVRSVGFKHGRWLDQVMMQRSLGAGDNTAPDGSELRPR